MAQVPPIVRPAIALVIGAAGMNLCLAVARPPLGLTFSLAAMAVLAVVALSFYKPWKKHVNTFGTAVLIAFALVGGFFFQWKYMNVEKLSHQGKRLRIGTVVSKPVEKEKWWTFRMKHRDGGVDMVYLAKGDTTKPQDIALGDSIYVISYFNYPTSHYLRKLEQKNIDEKRVEKENRKRERNKKKQKSDNGNYPLGSKTDNKGNVNDDKGKNNDFNLVDDEFEGYKRYLFYQGVSSVVFVAEAAWGPYYDHPDGLLIHRNKRPFWNDIAGKMRKKYEMAGFSDKAEAIVDAMTTGNKTAINKETKDNFAKAGISHVLALSGFHLTVIVALIDILLMRGLFKRRWKKWTALLVIPVIWAFAAIAGFPPSLVRATAMCSVIQLALVIGHEQQLKNACGIALFAMILYNPLQIMDVGFQLSFLSIVGIALLGLPLCDWGRRKFGKWVYVTDIITISFVCTLFTFPVVAYHFGQIPVYSIISNLMVSVIATLFMWAAVMWWIFVWWGFLNSIITAMLDFLANAMVWVAETVAQFPGATIMYKPNVFEVPFIYLIGAFAVYFITRRNIKYLYAAMMVIPLVVALHLMVK